jgi:8-oxo-dGTP pyrophosphatase MutT (NUDIX family)
VITRIVAKTFVYDEQGKLLLLVRSKDDVHRSGELDLPGGAVEPDEDIVAAAVREAQEEAGIKLKPSDMYLVYSRTGFGPNKSEGQATSLVRVFFVAKTKSTDVTLSHEHDDFMWLTPTEVEQRVNYPAHREALDYLKQNHILEDISR